MASASRPNSVPHPQMQHQQYCLRWNNYQNNLAIVLDQLLQNEALVDVTLACEGHAVKAHRVILAACSPYFQALFAETPCAHPIVILRDVGWPELKAVLEFVYKGEISVSHEQLGPLLKVAETLKIRGLADVGREPPHSPDPSPHPDPLSLVPQSALYNDPDLPLTPPPRKKRCREESPESPISREQVASDLLETTVEIGGGGSSTPALSPQCPSISPPLGPTPPPPNMNSSCSIQPINMSQSSHSQQMGSDLELKPGIVEMIREEERAKFLESSHNWLGATSSPITDCSGPWKLKAPAWTQEQLQDAIHAVVTQKMRFTQASALYHIPKGTLYDNILGKSKRMAVLDEIGLTVFEEETVLDFCCGISVMPYNRRTNKSLSDILNFVEKLKRETAGDFRFHGLLGYRWWWAFCKKHSIVSLYYKNSI